MPCVSRYCACRLIIALVFVIAGYTACIAQDTIKKAGPVSFKKHTISTSFVAEGVAVGDVDHDGLTDIMAGTYWYKAPAWQRQLIHADTLDPIPGYCTTFLNYALDVNNDGWIDLIRFDQPGAVCVWYENPKGKQGLWQQHMILPTAGIENPAFVDVDKDGRNDIICNDTKAKEVIWLKSPAGKADTVWKRTVISSDSLLATDRYTHGLGWGDVNKDGRNDAVIKSGWWEAPADVTTPNWKFHPADLGEDCSNMFVLDADGDGDEDIISASAHDYGIWWHEQVKEANGNVAWKTHEISKLFSQSHSLALADMNGDGHPDLVTGKRYFAHNGKDPSAFDPAVLYWFEYVPGKNPRWIPHEIDDHSGVGLSFVVKDINHDQLPDIIISNKKGVYYFEQVK